MTNIISEIIKKFDTKADFETCDIADVDIESRPGKVILDTEIVGGDNITLDATTNNRDMDTDASGSIVSLVTGMYGNYAIQIAKGQYIEYAPGDGVDVFPNLSAFTVEATFKLTESPDNYIYVVRFEDGGATVGDSNIHIYIDSSNKLIFRVRNDFGTIYEYNYGTINVGQKYRVAITSTEPNPSNVRTVSYFVDDMGTPVDSSTLFGGTCNIICDWYRLGDLKVWNPSQGKIIIDEIRISTKVRSSAEMADPGSSGFTVDGDTWALWHCEEINSGGTEQYKSNGTIRTPELTGDGFIYPELIQKKVTDLPTDTLVEMRYRAGEFDFGAWSDWVTADEINFKEVILYKRFQIEIKLSTTDNTKTPELDTFSLFGEQSTGSELMICDLNKIAEELDNIIVSLGVRSKEKLYDNRVNQYWKMEEGAWIDFAFEGDKHPEHVDYGFSQITPDGDGSESTDGDIFSTNTTSERWAKSNISQRVGEVIELRVKKATEGTTDRRGFEFAIYGENRHIQFYLWDDKVALHNQDTVNYAIDTSEWHTYQIYIGGLGANELELRIDGDPTVRLTGTSQAGDSSPGGITNGWVFPMNNYASSPFENLQIDYIRGGKYEPWHEDTITLENSNVKDLYAYAEITFETAQDISMAYIGKMINIKEWSLQYYDGADWKDWFVEMTVGDEFNSDFWWGRKDQQVSAEKVRLLIHNRIDTGEIAKVGELYVGNIVYQTPDTPENLEDNDEGKQGNIELGSGKVTTWQEYESYFGRMMFNLMNDRHQVKLRQFQQARQFMILLEPKDRIDRFYKVTWVGKWKSKYSTGYRKAGWDIEAIFKQTI